jgi:hypothetical protein
MTELKLFDCSVAELFGDRKLFDHALNAIMLEQAICWMAALEKLHRASEFQPAGVRQPFEFAGVDRADVAEDVCMLERVDEVKPQVEQRTLRTLDDSYEPTLPDPRQTAPDGTQPPQGNPHGQGVPTTDDVYSEVRDAGHRRHPVWARLRRARQLPGGQHFEGPDGEEALRREDFAHAESGIDYVATAERAANRSRAAQTPAGCAPANHAPGSSPAAPSLVDHAHRVLLAGPIHPGLPAVRHDRHSFQPSN